MRHERECDDTKNKKVVKKLLADDGIVPIDNQEITEKFLEYISDSVNKFPELFTKPIKISEDEFATIIGYVVGYDEKGDKPTDGRCIGRFRYNQDGNILESEHVICVKENTVKRGREYCILIFWHELTHALIDTDSPMLFHAMLDGLLSQYEARTGEHIQNDYCDPV